MGLVLQEKIENLHFPHESTLSWSKAKLDLALMLIRQRHQLQLQPSNFYFSGPTQDALWSKKPHLYASSGKQTHPLCERCHRF